MQSSGKNILNKTERTATPSNLRAVFYLLLKVNEKVDPGHWFCENVHPFSRWFLFYMIKEFLKKAFITESTKYVAIYGSIYYFNERKEDNGINLIILIDKLSFFVQHKSYRERILLQVAKLGSKTINTVSNQIKYFGILYTKKGTVVGRKRAMSCSVKIEFILPACKTLTNPKNLIQLR